MRHALGSDERERLRRIAFGRPPEPADGIAPDAGAAAWADEVARARVALAEADGADDPREPTAEPAASWRRRRARRRALLGGPAVGAAAVVVAGLAWASAPRLPEVPAANRLPAGWVAEHGMTDAQHLLTWHDTSILVARSATDRALSCLVMSRAGTIEFTCRDGLLEHRIFDTEGAELVWDPSTGLTVLPDRGEPIVVEQRLPA